jgi:hypothetical protein
MIDLFICYVWYCYFWKLLFKYFVVMILKSVLTLGRCIRIIRFFIIMKVSYLIILLFFLGLWTISMDPVFCMGMEIAGHGNPGFTPEFNPAEIRPTDEELALEEANSDDRPLTNGDVITAGVTTTILIIGGWYAWPFIKKAVSHAWWVWGKLLRGDRP